MYHWLLVAHIAVLGYWLGAELVINATYRYVCYAGSVPLAERSRLMVHVMNVDQHVRYALVLQATLGVMLAALSGHLPGGQALLGATAAAGLAWLVFIEVVHRLRRHAAGRILATIDRGSRYVLAIAAVALGLGLAGRTWLMPDWLRWKLLLFAGVILCGIGIRLLLLGHFRTWSAMEADGPTPEGNATVQRIYVRATSVLVLLWLFIAAIVFVSVSKPGP